jgi:hypothetical protein
VGTALSAVIDSAADPTITYERCEIAAELPHLGQLVFTPIAQSNPRGALVENAVE